MQLKISVSALVCTLPIMACSMNFSGLQRKEFILEAGKSYHQLFDGVVQCLQDITHVSSSAQQELHTMRLIAASQHALKSLMVYPPPLCIPTTAPMDRLLFKAIDLDGQESLEKALKNGANPNCYDHNGCTPLIEALGVSDVALRKQRVAFLLKAGANPNLASMESLTPLHCAVVQYQNDQGVRKLPGKLMQSFEIIKMLVEAGARPKIALSAEIHESGIATPLSLVRYVTTYNVNLIFFLLTRVYNEDILLGDDQKSITRAIMTRNKLLLHMSPLHPFILHAVAECKDKLGILELLEPDLAQENYERQVADNVAKMCNALMLPAGKPE